MPTELENRCRALLQELDLLQAGESLQARPLTGGVASDIARVTIGDRVLCAKFALPKLKVEADWFAPVQRNAAEYAWLEVAAAVAPEASLTLLGMSAGQHGFAMEYLHGDDTYLWKRALMDQANDRGEAQAVGDVLGRIHAASTLPGFEAGRFDNAEDFRALRIEPYLLFTASRHADIAGRIEQIAEQLYCSRTVLVHGDVSPKNILFRGERPVLLDAECATMGDASFDPSFCLNHIVLKAVHLPDSTERYLAAALSFWQAYARSVSWEACRALEVRVCRLLPVLMLARVDGKSPVEYLSSSEQGHVRELARHFILSPVSQVHELLEGIGKLSKEMAR